MGDNCSTTRQEDVENEFADDTFNNSTSEHMTKSRPRDQQSFDNKILREQDNADKHYQGDGEAPTHFEHINAAPFPLINSLPNGTSVMLIWPGVPKSAPWTIQELHPRHHYSPSFDAMPLAEQENEIFRREYLPFDAEGKPILLKYSEAEGKHIHVFPGQADWEDPIVDAVRRDAKNYRSPVTTTGNSMKRDVRAASATPSDEPSHSGDTIPNYGGESMKRSDTGIDRESITIETEDMDPPDIDRGQKRKFSGVDGPDPLRSEATGRHKRQPGSADMQPTCHPPLRIWSTLR